MGGHIDITRYTASFVNTLDGVMVVVHVAGVLGFQSWTRYRVQTSSDGQGGELVEDAKLQCPIGFGGFTKKEIEKSHPEAHQKIMQHLVKASG